MKTPLVRLLSACALGLLVSATARSQAPKIEIPQPSPAGTVQQRVGVTDIEVKYHRPSMKGRKIFGGLEPFGETWRAGANEATTVTFSTGVKIGETDVPAGTYALFAVLDPKEWTVIFSKKSDQWGAYSYDAKDDAARVKVPVVTLSPAVETFTIDINDIRSDSATLNLIWENTRVPVPLKFDTVATVVARFDEALKPDAKPGAGVYDAAALFYLENNLDLKKATEWINAAVAAQPNAFYMQYHKARILAKGGDKAGAKEAAQKSLELVKNAKLPASVREEYTRLNASLIESLGQ